MERRSFLGLIAGAAALAVLGRPSEVQAAPAPAAPEPAMPDMPSSVDDLREALEGGDGLPVEMQWRRRAVRRRIVRHRVIRRRPLYVRPRRRVVYVRRRGWGPRVVRRCWWNGWTTVCRLVRVW